MSAVLRHPSTWLAASALAALLLLVSGLEQLLNLRLPGGLPFGNLLVVIALLNMGLTGFVYSRRGTLLRLLSIATAMLALGWVPFTVATSGNLAANFQGDDAAYLLWLRYTGVGALLGLATLLATLTASIVDSRRAARD